MDVLKDRVGGFTECTFMMACPVLLAVATKKVNLSTQGNYPAVRNGIPPIAALSLFLCPLAFLILWIGSGLRRLWKLEDNGILPVGALHSQTIKHWILGLTKPVVHFSAILQMLLAYMIFVLITQKLGTLALTSLAICCTMAIALCIWSVVRTIYYPDSVENWEAAADTEDWWNGKLELSLDLSAAVTSILFLGLEGLALEGQAKVAGEDLSQLLPPLKATFLGCVFASVVMLGATVPPIGISTDAKDDNRRSIARVLIHALCLLLTVCLAIVVTMILVFLVLNYSGKEAKILGTVGAAAPISLLLLFYAVCLGRSEAKQKQRKKKDDEHIKPASLELTKVTFAAFLAVSLPSFRGSADLSTCTRAFLITTAMCVNFGVGWRFFSHFNQKAAFWTSKAACVLTHCFLAIAAFELVYMAKHTDTCFPIPTQNTTAT